MSEKLHNLLNELPSVAELQAMQRARLAEAGLLKPLIALAKQLERRRQGRQEIRS